ncbi:30S ribosomal protein S6 [Candidatus Nomurabacteria bacterium]|uniref:Small ribosomal subunit protein bS6 n=1 Tax=candidate division WWE3 bacterium TaxID=2053526 RepID=A0A955E0X8_UNCKA|nr:30S ribosomal protein S6 [candidate division WWE3 bacterium]MCB9823674.1 30S ribosomal protein S6 [Candidatus Nomurabacteria bacterium]MCB9827248.1 30S ribosomal protein S6 [Candidatus Nomurabacteria bacterium]MCB9827469.1 30S ribosomal protein S6 [Candidatus Nomurabacteria bacterium]HXK52591.1 30S ribosomal protein S6 [bacterium]
MKQYELMTITDIDLGEDGSRDISNKIKDLIASKKGKVLDSDFWGKRRFAYEIDHKSEGFYEVMNFELPADAVSALKSELNYITGLVRYLVTATN